MAPLDLWYKDAVFYCLDVEYFADGDGDGVGDFKGLTQKLDYLAGIGVTCIWLLPFFASPNRDNGYDISDYYAIDPRHGTLGDFVEFSHQAHQRGMRVIVDLVVNHTSDQHAWFQAGRKDRKSRYFDYYVWSEKKPKDAHQGMVFPGHQESTWTYDKQAKAYYFHRFYEFQPDLNIGNPDVREEILKIVGFWLELGVSGFRMDAVPFLVEKESLQYEPPPDTGPRRPQTEAAPRLARALDRPMDLFTQLRDFMSWRSRDAIMLAEANLPMDVITGYFGDNDRIHMVFNFLLNQHLWLGLATEQAGPIGKVLQSMPEIPYMGQWANFLRNHDEIDLGRLSDEEQQAVFARCGPDPEMQLYNRGIRRRLAPMLGGDQRHLRLAFSLMFSLPGTPVLWYGDEIGMGDDLRQPEREGLRMPMQWSDKPNAGFSTAPAQKLVKPVISDGPYGYEHVNVSVQRREPDSLLNWIERIIRTRKECPEIGWGQAQVMDVGEPSVFAHCVEWHGGVVVAAHNLSSEARVITLDLSQYQAARLVDLLGDREQHELQDGTCKLLLEGYGYRWLRLESR